MELKHKTISGLVWAGMGTASKLVSQFITTAILARFLLPADFGLVAMAVVFTEFAVIFSDMGISSALIQRQDATEEHYSSAFWLNVMVGALLTITIILASPLVARFYNKPQLQLILAALSLNCIFSSFIIIQQTHLKKDMEFKKLMLRDIAAVVLSSVVGIWMAYHGYGAWSLVWQSVSYTLINAISLWFLSSWRPMFVFSKKCVTEIFSFSVHVTGSSVVYYFTRNIDKLLIGKFLGAQSLGVYGLAYKIMMYPLYHVSWVVNQVMYPAFSRLQNDLPKFQATYKRVIKGVSLLTFPLMFCFFTIAPEFVHTVYGAEWEPVIFLVRVLCFSGMLLSISSVTSPIYSASGRPDLKLKIDVINTVLVTLSILIGLKWGIKGVAISFATYSLIWEHLYIFLATRIMKMNFWQAYSVLIPAYILSLVAAIVMFCLKHFINFSGFLGVFLFFVISGIIYCSLLFVSKVIAIKEKTLVYNS